MRIAYFGLPLGALLLARDGHEIAYAAACRAAPGLRRLATRVAVGRCELRPDAAAAKTIDRVRAASPELIVSWFWTTKIPEPILRLAPSVGMHPSLLPRHRGPDPCFWAIDAGDPVTGVTAHRLGVDYDTGEILASCELRIDPTWNGWRLARALDRPSLVLLRDVVSAHAEGRPPRSVPQDDRFATSAPEPSDEELAIAWSSPAARIDRRVRAAAPWPGAWTEIADRIVTLVRVGVTRDFPRALEPGEAAVRSDGVAVVRAADDALALLEGRGEDDSPLGSRELADLVRAAGESSRFPIARGDRLRFDQVRRFRTVSDAVTLARIARESLARGLNALQADPNVPQRLLELAAPIAQAMGALHQIERSGGAQIGSNAQTALAHVQTALAELQAQPTQYPAVNTALEAVAGALGTVHSLARAVAPPPGVPQRVAPPPQPQRVAPQRPAAAPPQAAAVPAPPVAQAAHPRAPAQGGDADFASATTAELGAHSPSNFYKGLSGNDIIEHGGLFVSTYKLPKIGQSVRLKVSLPGGYEFEANAVVRWRREPSDSGNDAPPGFGAQFTEITPEARQLVYRYVRNREPLFHDDL